MREEIKEKKKRCPLCKREYASAYNYCRSDGKSLEMTDAERGDKLSSTPDEGYTVDDFYTSKPA